MISLIERAVEQLDDKAFALFRDWFMAYEHARWDRQIEADSTSGKLDAMIDEARADHWTASH